MYWAYTIAGFIIGGVIAGYSGFYFLSAIAGGAIGFLLARVQRLQKRIEDLEYKAHQQSAAEKAQPVQPDFKPEPNAEPETKPPFEPEAEPGRAFTAEAAPPAGATIGIDQRVGAVAADLETGAPAPKRAPELPWGWPSKKRAGPSAIDILLEKSRSWLTTGNIPVKVGVIVSFVGVSFLLKYAIDQRLLVIPLEARLLAVAAAGLALVINGWRLRERLRVYALSLQGGGLGILFLTIFAALRIWNLLPAPLAFLLLVALTASTGALSVLQNALSLAILGIVGGFLAPVLTSTGQGGHVTLFSYYLVLNGAILGIAWFRAWRELNLVGFVFTFVIGSFWGYQYYTPELWASTQPFLILHFLFYQGIAILYALRQPPERIGIVDGALVFGTPVIAFALQYALVRDSEYGLAISAAVVAVFYALTATMLYRRKAAVLPMMVESFMALAVVFATLAIPLALDARWTSAAWSLEGAALVWVGTRQGRQLAKLAGTALLLFGGMAFLDYGWRAGAGPPVLNGNVLGGVLISLSAFFASRKLQTEQQQGFEQAHRVVAVALFLWAALWWLGTGWQEVTDRLAPPRQLPAFLIFLSVSFGAAGRLGRMRRWDWLRDSLLVFLPLLAVIAFLCHVRHQHLLLDLGWLAWPLAVVLQVQILRTLDDTEEPGVGIWHFVSVLLLTLLLALEAAWWTEQMVSGVWAAAVASAVAGVMALAVWRFRRRPAWPIPAHPTEYLVASLLLVSSQLVFLVVLSLALPGDPGPWPYLPVLNPFDLAMLFAMLTAALSLTVLKREAGTAPVRAIGTLIQPYRRLLAGAFFVMTTAALVRGVHHFSSVPWNFAALFDSVFVQTALSIYWGLLGFAGMIWGARSRHRLVWLTGAGFMALVVIKLFLIDLGNTGTVERIISFIGIGALLLVVGYFAPVPPRQAAETPAGEDGE
jgi:uncharacterized membrane protein